MRSGQTRGTPAWRFSPRASFAARPAAAASERQQLSTSANSKAEFVREAHAICQPGNAHIGRAVHDLLKSQARLANKRGESIGPPTSAEVAKLGEVAIPTVQRELDQIRALGPAPGAEQKIKALLDEEQSALDKVRTAPTLFGSQSKAGSVQDRASWPPIRPQLPGLGS